MGRLSTHVLNTANGRPAAGMTIEFLEQVQGQWQVLKTVQTNSDGRADEPLLAAEAMRKGRFRLVFHVAAYFQALGSTLPEPPFLDLVPLEFNIFDSSQHYHVPLLCSPWSYSTYRGS